MPMIALDGWDIALLAIGGYVSVITLIRMMRRRREHLVDDLLGQVRAERKRATARKKKQERAEARARLRQRPAA